MKSCRTFCLAPSRLASRVKRVIRQLDLDLSGLTVLTEAATRAYSVTPVLAACANASTVYALARDSSYGSADEAETDVMELAEKAGAKSRIHLVNTLPSAIIKEADIVTNSGHLRPIKMDLISQLKSTSVISLMYATWEYREGDIDIVACTDCQIPVIGSNECHPDVAVFDYLGMMAVKLMLDAGISIVNSKILLLCDNLFSSHILRTLQGIGASLELFTSCEQIPDDCEAEAVLVASSPSNKLHVESRKLSKLSRHGCSPVILQFWGDVDRAYLENLGFEFLPEKTPLQGHMGVIPSDVGPEPVVRLQAGGLKAAGIVARERLNGVSFRGAIDRAIQSGWADGAVNDVVSMRA